MSRAALAVSLLVVVGAAACSKVADLVGAVPNRQVASVTLHVPDSLFVGDTVPISADPLSADGRPAGGDTAVTWRTSDPSSLAFNAGTLPTPAPNGFTRLVGKGSGQTTVTAQVAQVTASKRVTIVGAGDIAVGDQRFGYALAEQPAATAPYAPDPAYRFNSSGGPVTVTHDSVGTYLVRFAGLARKAGQRDNAQVVAYGAPPGTHCKLYNSQTDGADMIVPVHCHAPGADGPFADAKFTVLFAAARAFDPSSPFAFAMRLPQTQSIVLDTSQTAFNSATGHIVMGGGGGVWNFVFPGIGPATTPVALLATGVGQGPEHCRVTNFDLNGGGLQAGCNGTDGAPIGARVSVMWFTRGRPGHRFAFASTNNIGAVTPPTDPPFTFNSSGGAVTSRRLAVGQWTVTFAGLARPGGGGGTTEIAIVSALKELDHSCSVASWGTSGANDLSVTLTCFDASGAPVDARFTVLVVE